MKRWLLFLLCAVLGLGMLVGGLLVPMHLRAVDASVVQKAGWNTTTLVERGLALVNEKNLGAAELLLQTAQKEEISDREKLGLAVTNLAKQNPNLQVWGIPEPRVAALFGKNVGPLPFIELIIRQENRGKVLELLKASSRPGVQELLRCRALTNTILFPPSQSASGQAFDAALSVGGLLVEEGRLTPALSNAVLALAAEANRGGSSQPLEQVLMDLMSLGQRFNLGQLAAFVGKIEDAETLRLLANHVRKADAQLPVLFSAVQLSGKPADVAKYLMQFSQSGLKDLGASLRFGEGGVNELLRRKQQLYASSFHERVPALAPPSAFFNFATDYSLRKPWLALTLKWSLYLIGGFLLAAAMHFARPAVSALERPLQVGGFHLARESLFALGFLLVVLLLSEPFLAQESQKVEFPFRLRLPTVGSVVPVGNTGAHASIMNQLSLLTLLLFFVLQALIYTACLVKLAEIRRQNITPRLKLKLLENEDHLFDAGLYLGFAGTIISLILVSMGVIKPSLMAAYSSTSFGIIFVSVFKIFNLRPLRRKLLLEADAATTARMAPAAEPTFTTMS
ncbi:MAG: hypothetical protein HY298_03720 [Verrucomicrobia bacterium]|nr:hypothetical protein [Verrucomicrobiota bacterium]